MADSQESKLSTLIAERDTLESAHKQNPSSLTYEDGLKIGIIKGQIAALEGNIIVVRPNPVKPNGTDGITAYRHQNGNIEIDVPDEFDTNVSAFDDIKRDLFHHCNKFKDTGLMPSQAFSDCYPEEPSTDYYVGVTPELDIITVHPTDDLCDIYLVELFESFRKEKLIELFRVKVENNLL